MVLKWVTLKARICSGNVAYPDNGIIKCLGVKINISWQSGDIQLFNFLLLGHLFKEITIILKYSIHNFKRINSIFCKAYINIVLNEMVRNRMEIWGREND